MRKRFKQILTQKMYVWPINTWKTLNYISHEGNAHSNHREIVMPTRMAKIKKADNTKDAGEDEGHSYTVGGKIKSTASSGNCLTAT